MVKHLYKLKKPCVAVEQDIELTPEIKKQILRLNPVTNNRVTQNIMNNTNNNTTNNNNNINYNITINCVNNMSLDKKIQLMVNHMGMTIEPIQDCIEKRTRHFLESQGELRGVGDLKLLAQCICKPLSDEIFNPAYIKKENMCSTLEDSETERVKQTPLTCLKSMLTILQDQTSGEYEVELVKEHDSGRQGSREAIIELYSFYKDVGIIPFVNDLSDRRITGRGSISEFNVAERHMRIFNSCKKTKNTKELLDIMMSFCNVSKLNAMIIENAKSSDEFNATLV
jgi:hypothetical protein